MGNPVSGLLSKLIQKHNSCPEWPDVLYLGDSVVSRTSRHDHDQRGLAQIAGMYLALHGRDVQVVGASAGHMGFFFYFLRALEEMGVRPRLVILPVNMRSFSPQWTLNPLYQCRIQIAWLKQYISAGRVCAPPADKEDMDVLYREFLATPVECPLSRLTLAGEFRAIKSTPAETKEDIRVRYQQIFAFHYTCPLDPGHHRLATLREIFALLERIGAAAFLYLTPINYEGGQEYVGKDFLEAFLRNVGVVTDLVAPYEETGRVCLVDYSTSLPSSCFFHDEYACEHLNEAGRVSLAQNISAEVLRMLQKEACLATNLV